MVACVAADCASAAVLAADFEALAALLPA